MADCCLTDLSSRIVQRILSSEIIWEGLSRAVFRVGQDVVVKVAQDLDPDEHGILQYLEARIPTIAAPCALGLITVGSTSFMFMTLVPGVMLETRWPSLSADAKTHIRHALDESFGALCQLELPAGCPLGPQ